LIRRETGKKKERNRIHLSLEKKTHMTDRAQRSVSSTMSSSSIENPVPEELSLGAVLLYLTALEPLLRGGRGGGGRE